MTANDNNCYLSYLNKFVGEFNNTYNRFIGKKPICADQSAVTEDIGDRVRITKYNNIFSKGYTENGSIKIFGIGSVLKTNLINENIKSKS